VNTPRPQPSSRCPAPLAPPAIGPNTSEADRSADVPGLFGDSWHNMLSWRPPREFVSAPQRHGLLNLHDGPLRFILPDSSFAYPFVMVASPRRAVTTGLRCALPLIFAPTLAGCLVYSDSINQAPTIELAVDSTTTTVNTPVVFTATPADANDAEAALQVEFFKGAGPCPPDSAAVPGQGFENLGGRALQLASSLQKVVLHPTLGPFCVQARVRDPQGAMATAQQQVQVENQAPEVVFEASDDTAAEESVRTIASYEPVRISAQGSTDPEGQGLTFAWSMRDGAGAQVPLAVCSDTPQGEAICLPSLTPGRYVAEVTVTDSEGLQSRKSTEIAVLEDSAPCLSAWSPQLATVLRAPSELAVFEILGAADDGDPYPPRLDVLSQLNFTWFVRLNNSTWDRIVQSSRPEFSLPSDTYRTGDVVEIRVEIADRQGDRGLSGACPLDEPTCTLAPPNPALAAVRQEGLQICLQRWTWRVEYRL